MKKNPSILLLLMALLSPLPGLASVTLSLTPLTGTSISPGGSVTFDVNLTINGGEDLTGVDYDLLAPASGEFTLETFSNASSPFGVLGPTGANGSQLNPASMDLGAGSTAGGVSNGTYLLSQITLQANSSLGPNSYDIQTSSADWINGTFASEPFTLAAEPLVLNVTPEPSAWLLILGGVGSLVLTMLLKRIVVLFRQI